MMPKRIAEVSLDFTGLYESELLTELMLRYWNHPSADDDEFRNTLLETAAEVLRASIAGETFIENVPPEQMNIVSAIWFAEFHRIENDSDVNGHEKIAVQEWLRKVRRSVPACFCDQDLLS
jgi:hypothetical protein